jgi:hypothetical protein
MQQLEYNKSSTLSPEKHKEEEEEEDPLPSTLLFYMYVGRMFHDKPLMYCRKATEGGKWPWEEQNTVETVQNTGALWLHEALRFLDIYMFM